MVGERSQHGMMVHVPPWTFMDDPTAAISPFSPLSPNAAATTNSPHNLNSPEDCPYFFRNDAVANNNNHLNSPEDYPYFLRNDAVANNHNLNSLEDYSYFLRNDAALRRYLEEEFDGSGSDLDLSSEAYTCDSFRMYEFKIRKCTRARSHDWTDCPYAHPGEKARRRDPRKFNYSGTACPDFRKGSCKKGDGCEFSHGVFECWLHPQRYRTQPCKDGVGCRRRVCFFAHTAEQLRVLSPSTADSSPLKGFSAFFSSPSEASTPPSESPPMSPMGSLTVNDMLTSLRRLQLSKTLQMGRSLSSTRPGFSSLPSTPTRALTRPGFGLSEIWERGGGFEEEPVMERVESGRVLREKMFEKLSKENPLLGSDPTQNPDPGEGSNPDVGWISELLK